MFINRATDYAVRAMIDLASQPDGERVTTQEIAHREHIPLAFLSKVTHRLSQAGLIRAQRGISGGLTLARTPEQITLLEIVEALQGPLVINLCTDPSASCPREEGKCAAHLPMERLQKVMQDNLAAVTLAEMTNGNRSHKH